MTANNTRIWDVLFKTDPVHTKQFSRAGGFKGTAISPMWAVQRMTELFGPIGDGWGVEVRKTEVIQSPHTPEALVFCLVAVWYRESPKEDLKYVGPQWGGDRVFSTRKDGSIVADDEAFKKAATDGMSKCLSYLGLGADVHLGLYDDSKYVNAIGEQFDKARPNPALPPPTPPSEIQTKMFIAIAARIKKAFETGGATAEQATAAISGFDSRFGKGDPAAVLNEMESFTQKAEKKANEKLRAAEEAPPLAPEPDPVDPPSPKARPSMLRGKKSAEPEIQLSLDEKISSNWITLGKFADAEGMTADEWFDRKRELLMDWAKEAGPGGNVQQHIHEKQLEQIRLCKEVK